MSIKHGKLPLYIDIVFCTILLPFMIFLLPIDKWIVNNPLYVIGLSAWYYMIYFSNRRYIVPLLFGNKQERLLGLALIFISLLITYFISVYHLDALIEHAHPKPPHWGSHRPPPPMGFRLKQQAVWFLYMVVFSFSTAVGLLTELYKQMVARQNIEAEKNKAELALYKAQINPYFLFNTLNMMYGMVITQSEKSEKVFMQFIQLVKYMYTHATQDFIPITTEVEYLQQYINLQEYRFNEHTHVHFSFDDDGKREEVMIAPMLLITFVENCMKYGVSTHQESHIYINLTLREGELTFTTQNQIITAPKEDEPKVGIENTRQRLQLLYPYRHQLIIENDALQHRVTLTIQL